MEIQWSKINETEFRTVEKRLQNRAEKMRQKCAEFNISALNESLKNALHIPTFNLSTCFLPKTGSLTWSHHLLSATTNKSVWFYQSRRSRFNLHRVIESQFPASPNRSEFADTTSFLFVRHPFVRLVSAFVMRFPHFRKRVLSEFAEMKERRPGRPPFRAFVRMLLTVGIDGMNDKHFSLMHERCDVCHTNFDYVGKIETEEDDRKFLLRRLRLPVAKVAVHLNQRNRQNKSRSTSKLARIFFATLDKSDIEKLYELYKLDFELFGYSYKDFYNLGRKGDNKTDLN